QRPAEREGRVRLERVGTYLWQIPQDTGRGMRVPGLVIADEQLIESIRSDASLDQIANGATLPGIVRAAMAMPDIHQGYGLPVGGVVATDARHGVVSPGAIGFDINCGVRLLGTALRADTLADRMEALVDALYTAIPTGVGSRGELTLDANALDHVLARGAAWAVKTGYGDSEDLARSATGRALRRYGISVPDRQLACAPVDSDEARAYLGAMRAAANFAFANRQVLTHWTRQVFERSLQIGPRELGMRVVYDVAHNIAKEEEHDVDGARRRLIVHRKGATRAFPGQPVLVPGDMGRYSYLLLGTEQAMRETFGSTCHGAGRRLSRTAAVKAARGRRIGDELRERGVLARATGRDALAEEMPEAYKDVADVVDVVHRFGISTRVA